MFLTDQIEETTRSRDEDIDSIPQCCDLSSLADSAEYDGRPESRVSSIRLYTLADLDSELTSRSEDKGADRSAWGE